MREKAKDDLKSFALTAMSQSTRGTGTYWAAQHDQELLSTWPRSVLSACRQRRIASLGWRLRLVDSRSVSSVVSEQDGGARHGGVGRL